MIETLIYGFAGSALPFVPNNSPVLKLITSLDFSIAVFESFFINEPRLNVFDNARYVKFNMFIFTHFAVKFLLFVKMFSSFGVYGEISRI